MSRIDLSTHELFLRLGATPTRRSARADQLFRRLRNEEEQELVKSLRRAPHRLRPRLKRDKPGALTALPGSDLPPQPSFPDAPQYKVLPRSIRDDDEF